MSDAPKPLLRWRQVVSRRAPRAPDPADMGTAFGLEYILDQDAASHQGEHAEAPGAHQAGWLRRWFGTKPAA